MQFQFSEQLIVWLYIIFQLVLIFYLARLCIKLVPLIFIKQSELPFVPSSPKSIRALVKSATLKDKNYIIDLGCGDGQLLSQLMKQYPHAFYYGIEQKPFLVWMAKQRLGWRTFWQKIFRRDSRPPQKRFTIEAGDMFGAESIAHISQADAIVGFWVTSVMPRLITEFIKSTKPGCVIVSNLFSFPDSPQLTEHFTQQEIPVSRNHTLFVYIKK